MKATHQALLHASFLVLEIVLAVDALAHIHAAEEVMVFAGHGPSLHRRSDSANRSRPTGVRLASICIRACSRSIARSTTWSIVADDTEMGAALADAATGCAAALGDGGSGCPRGEAGLDCAAESGVRSDAR